MPRFEQCAQVEDRIFAAFARERETQLLKLQQQESRLAARLTFEERKALSTAVKKLRDSMAKDEKELSALEHKLRLVHEKSDKLKEVRAAEEFCGVMMELSGGEHTVAALRKHAAMLLSKTPDHLMIT